MFGRDGHKKRPITCRGAEREAEKIEPAERCRDRKEKHKNQDHRQHQITDHYFFSGLKILTQQTAQQISGRQTDVRIHDRCSGDHAFDAHFFGEADAKCDQYTDDIPDGQTDKNAADVFDKSLPVAEERKEIPTLYTCFFAHMRIHPRLHRSYPQEQQEQSQSAAHDISHLPADESRSEMFVEIIREEGSLLSDHRSEDCSEGSEGHDEHGSVAPGFLAHGFYYQGDSRAQLSGQTETGDKANRRIAGHIGDEGIGDIGDGIQEDRTEKHFEPAFFIAQDAPENTSGEHANHLAIKEKNFVGLMPCSSKPKSFKAFLLDDVEENEIVDIDEIAQ